MIQSVVSFDCANRSLAYTFANVNLNYTSLMIQLEQQLCQQYAAYKLDQSEQNLIICARTIAQILYTVDNAIKVIRCGVVDVLGGLNVKETDSVQRTQYLCNILNGLNIDYANTTVIIEDQPDISASNIIQAQITMYCAAVHGSQIVLIDPSCKNHIDLEPSISYNTFLQHCNSRYQANKMHSAATFMRFIKNFGFEHMLKTINKANKYDDLADSFMQLLVYMSPEYRKKK